MTLSPKNLGQESPCSSPRLDREKCLHSETNFRQVYKLAIRRGSGLRRSNFFEATAKHFTTGMNRLSSLSPDLRGGDPGTHTDSDLCSH